MDMVVYLPVRNSMGCPEVLRIVVQVTEQGYFEGLQYEYAATQAENAGYSVPDDFVAFDERDIKGLNEHWDKISYTLQ